MVISENSFSQNKRVFVHDDYLISTQKFHFIINDTIIKTNICIRPNGIFDFKRRPKYASEYIFLIIQKGDSIFNLDEKYVENNKDTIFLKSYFPPLLTHDSSLLIYGEYPFDSSNMFYYEMKYSTILSNFNKSKLTDYKSDTVVRIILPIIDTSSRPFYPVTYSIVELKIKNRNGILNFSEGHYNNADRFIVTINQSCDITEKELKKTIKRIQKVDFKKEYYTAVVGLMPYKEYFIEIKLNDKYFALERAWGYGIEKGIKMRAYPDNKQISKLYENILNIKTKLLN